MQLPKKPHSPQSYKKNRIYKICQRVNKTTGQQVKKKPDLELRVKLAHKLTEKPENRYFKLSLTILRIYSRFSQYPFFF